METKNDEGLRHWLKSIFSDKAKRFFKVRKEFIKHVKMITIKTRDLTLFCHVNITATTKKIIPLSAFLELISSSTPLNNEVQPEWGKTHNWKKQ